ncbi:MAG: nicotinate phosphoribosyltransferase, partial [Atopobiaceae bacterium]|nr:nicotinate phosphoribosyltransferase [Atopobiaceae bacterium]
GTDVKWSLEDSKRRCREAIMRLDPAVRRFLNPQTYPVGMEAGLAKMRNDLALEELQSSGR